MFEAELNSSFPFQTQPKGKAIGKENASIYFVGTATTIIEWNDIRIMTDPKSVSIVVVPLNLIRSRQFSSRRRFVVIALRL